MQGVKEMNFIAFGIDRNDACLFELATLSVCIGQQDVATMIDKIATEIVDVKEKKYDTSK